MAGNPVVVMGRHSFNPVVLGPLRHVMLDGEIKRMEGVLSSPLTWIGAEDSSMARLPYGLRAIDHFVDLYRSEMEVRVILLRVAGEGESSIWAQLWTGPKETAPSLREELRRVYRESWAQLLPPPARQNDTLGFRFWAIRDDGMLFSPVYPTRWRDGELIDERIDMEHGEGAHKGIHAHLMPRDWRRAAECVCSRAKAKGVAAGIVERFGKSVVGTKGWRAEWVVIREIVVPEHHRLAVEQKYPDVIVHGTERIE